MLRDATKRSRADRLSHHAEPLTANGRCAAQSAIRVSSCDVPSDEAILTKSENNGKTYRLIGATSMTNSPDDVRQVKPRGELLSCKADHQPVIWGEASLSPPQVSRIAPDQECEHCKSRAGDQKGNHPQTCRRGNNGSLRTSETAA